jgi:hypothetical protein
MVVVLIDVYQDASLASSLLARVRLDNHRTLAWMRRQVSPLLLATMGPELDDRTAAKLRARYGVPPESALITGKRAARCGRFRDRAPLDSGNRVRGSFADLMGVGGIRFDSEFAERIFGVLEDKIDEARRAE